MRSPSPDHRAFDLLVVGAGMAGLMAALTLWERRPDARVAFVDRGHAPGGRRATPSSYEGFGGAGLYLGGRLYLGPATIPVPLLVSTPQDEHRLLTGESYAERREEVVALLDHLGARAPVRAEPPAQLAEAVRAAATAGLDYVTSYPTRVLPREERDEVLAHLRARIEGRGGVIRLGTWAVRVERVADGFAVTVEPVEGGEARTLTARALLLAPGRYGTEWLVEAASELGAPPEPLPSAFGVRVEVPAEVYAPLTSVNPDPRLQLPLPGDVMLRTYATCPGGYVAAVRRYGWLVASGVPVMTPADRGPETTFALLAQAGNASDSVWRAGEESAAVLNARSPHALIVQRLGDVRARRATSGADLAASPVQPSAADANPGVLYDAYPDVYWEAVEVFLARLERLAPGVSDGSTLLYGPAEERFWHFVTDGGLRTRVPGLFVAGDAAGHSQGIIQAGVAGTLAGDGIARYLASDQARENGAT